MNFGLMWAKRRIKSGWLIYAYHRATGEIVAYVWGKRNTKTVKELRDELMSPN